MDHPAFLITIDTEGDDIWSRPHEITTRNASFLPRFQSLCEAYGMRPTYLVNWEMIHSPEFQELGIKAQAQGTAEIGMHLHAWNTPPIVPLCEDDYLHTPYLIEYPEALVREKVRRTTEAIETVFDRHPISHRAGRWAIDEIYARVLADAGYLVDCSVTPGVSWRAHPGDPAGNGGADYSEFPSDPYFVDLDAIDRPGDSPLLEVPMTIQRSGWPAPVGALRWIAPRLPQGQRVMDRFFPEFSWLRPNGRNLQAMLRILDTAVADGRSYVEFMLHSSEFMPGGSPYFPTEHSIEVLYDHMERLFDAAADRFEGMTLETYFHRFSQAAISA